MRRRRVLYQLIHLLGADEIHRKIAAIIGSCVVDSSVQRLRANG